jgi:hypothetical protein
METHHLRPEPTSDPTVLYRYRDGLYAADLLATALVHLDFFTWLETNPCDKPAICAHFQTTERPTDVMLTLFTAMGLLSGRAGKFFLTPVAREYLVSHSPWFLGPYYAVMKERPVCLDFLKVLRTGKPANWDSRKDAKAWAQAMEDDAFAREFTAAMDCRGRYLGNAVARALDLHEYSSFLDIAGGSGIYACSIVAAHPHVRATVLEKPPVDKIAGRLIAERGYAGRVGVETGDMFADPLPPGHDAHLFSNVLHDWEEGVVRRLLASSFEALPAGGLLVIHDAHINAEKTGPLHVAEYSALLMHSTEGKCYSVAELDGYLREIGFIDCTFAPTAAARSVVTARRPKRP